MKKQILAAAVLATLAGTGTATAATSFTNLPEPVGTNQTGLLDKFDPGLGVLTAVSLSWGGSATTSFSVINDANQPQSARATMTVDLAFSSNDSAISAILSTLTLSLQARAGNSFIVSPGGSDSIGPLTDSETGNFTAGTGDAILSAFTGPGTFSIDCSSASGLAVIGGGGLRGSSEQTTAGCFASVTYDFEPRSTNVPEPGTLALLGLATVGIAGMSRRSRKH